MITLLMFHNLLPKNWSPAYNQPTTASLDPWLNPSSSPQSSTSSLPHYPLGRYVCKRAHSPPLQSTYSWFSNHRGIPVWPRSRNTSSDEAAQPWDPWSAKESRGAHRLRGSRISGTSSASSPGTRWVLSVLGLAICCTLWGSQVYEVRGKVG